MPTQSIISFTIIGVGAVFLFAGIVLAIRSGMKDDCGAETLREQQSNMGACFIAGAILLAVGIAAHTIAS